MDKFYTLSLVKRKIILHLRDLLGHLNEYQLGLFKDRYPQDQCDLSLDALERATLECERVIQMNRAKRGEKPNPHEPRDYDDFNRKDIAIYNFRGYTVLKFWKKDAPDGMKFALKWGDDANNCCFIPSDFKYMREFLDKCYAFTQDETKDFDGTDVD